MLNVQKIVILMVVAINLNAQSQKHSSKNVKKVHKHIEHKHSAKNVKKTHKKIKYPSAQENIIILEIDGLVCSFCAYATEKRMARFNFVDKSKFGGDGVEVLPEMGYAKIAIHKNKAIAFQKILQAIAKAGYVLRAIHFKQKGRITQKQKQIFFTSSYTNQKILLDKKAFQGVKIPKKIIKLQGVFTSKAITQRLGISVKSWK